MSEWDWAGLRNRSAIVEDAAILALNKPAGISVIGDSYETDIVRLASEAKEQLFPVHRIDKVTTGVVLFAKNIEAHGNLTRQFNKRTVDKRYLIITKTVGLPPEGIIDLPLTTGRKGLVRIAALKESIQWDTQNSRWWVPARDHLPDKKLYPSLTRFATLWSDSEFSLVLAQPVSGRKQQLRVHFAWIGHPIFRDPLFDKTELEAGWQTCLHSWRLEFDAAWRDGTRMEIEGPPPPEFWRPLETRLPTAVRTELLKQARKYQFRSTSLT